MDTHSSPDRIRFAQFRARVIKPTLGFLGAPYDSDAACNLLLGTAAQETQLLYFAQYPSGPALGPYEIEPATHDDLVDRDLMKPEHAALRVKVFQLAAAYPDRRLQLATNAAYATAIARVRYVMAPDPLPDADDIDGLGKYYVRFFNAGGKATVAEFVSNYRRFIGG